MLLITDTYLSSVPFGGEVIKNNNENPSSGKANMIKGLHKEKRKTLFLNYALPWATKASLESETFGWSPVNLICFFFPFSFSRRPRTSPPSPLPLIDRACWQSASLFRHKVIKASIWSVTVLCHQTTSKSPHVGRKATAVFVALQKGPLIGTRAGIVACIMWAEVEHWKQIRRDQ